MFENTLLQVLESVLSEVDPSTILVAWTRIRQYRSLAHSKHVSKISKTQTNPFLPFSVFCPLFPNLATFGYDMFRRCESFTSFVKLAEQLRMNCKRYLSRGTLQLFQDLSSKWKYHCLIVWFLNYHWWILPLKNLNLKIYSRWGPERYQISHKVEPSSDTVIQRSVLEAQLFVGKILGRPTMTDFYPYAKAVANQLNSLATVRGMYFSSGDLWFDRCFEVVVFLIQHPSLSNGSKRRSCLLFTKKVRQTQTLPYLKSEIFQCLFFLENIVKVPETDEKFITRISSKHLLLASNFLVTKAPERRRNSGHPTGTTVQPVRFQSFLAANQHENYGE